MDESHFRTLKELSRNGEISQRDLSRRIGLSLGRINYIVNSLIRQGYVKAMRFKNSRRKLAYMYVLTPEGVRKKTDATRHFIARKTEEYHRLREEIEELKHEIDTAP